MAVIVCACGRQVQTQPEWAGQWITCPGCSGSLYAPFPGDKPSVPTSLPAEASAQAGPTRLCALCAETIPVADVRCRYCGNDPTGAAPPRVPSAVPTAPTTSSDEGTPVLMVALVGLMFCQFLSPIAWAMGSAYEAKCRARGETPSSSGHAGKIVGIVGTVMLGLGCVWFALSLVAG
jgi:hypothetical protein